MNGDSLRLFTLRAGVLGGCVLAVLSAASVRASAQSLPSWNPKAAAAYLDQRENWWAAWPAAARDHGTFCVSCHTAVPYALARPNLPGASSTPGEQQLFENVTKRVRLWKVVSPFYTDQQDGVHKTAQARGTEAVLNALILASRDSPAGKLSDDARTAFDNMWALQQTAGEAVGAWDWLQFNNEPWEAYDSPFYGASLAAVAVGVAPGDYRSTPSIRNRVRMLREYLNRECDRQSPVNQAVLLWASSKWPGLLPPEKRRSIIGELAARQRADGGWSLALLVGAWKRADGTPLVETSDGYATGLVTLALEQAGLPPTDSRLHRGLAWLVRNQNQAGGYWRASSLNRKLDPAYGPGLFMTDAATAYSVLALTETKVH